MESIFFVEFLLLRDRGVACEFLANRGYGQVTVSIHFIFFSSSSSSHDVTGLGGVWIELLMEGGDHTSLSQG